MRMRDRAWVAALLLSGCWASHLEDAESPAEAPAPAWDGGLAAEDTGPPIEPRCPAYEPIGCALSRWGWFWNGADCSPMFECWERGHRSREGCLRAHRACGAVPDCAPMPVTVGLECADDTTRAFWDGAGCVVMDRCQCVGECLEGLLFETMEACEAEYRGCG